MINFLTFSDLELDFLKVLGFEFKDNGFYQKDTGYKYTCIGSKSTRVKDYGLNDFYTYEFKHLGLGGGSIIFIRSNRDYDADVPSIIVRFKDFSIAIGESDKNDVHEKMLGHVVTPEKDEILRELKNITIQVHTKNGNKKTKSLVKIIPFSTGFLSFTTIVSPRGTTTLEGSMDGIEFVSNTNTYYDNSVEAYEEILRDNLTSSFRDDSQSLYLFRAFVPYFTKVYEASLHIPALLEDQYRNEYQQRREDINRINDEIISEAQESMKKDLADINKTEEKLNNMVDKYPLGKGKQK